MAFNYKTWGQSWLNSWLNSWGGGSAPAPQPDVIDTHDGGGPARRKISSERPRKERKEREDILREIKLAMGLLEEPRPEVQSVEKVIERAKKFIPQAPNINLDPLINQLRTLESALRKYEQDREEEEEILILTMLA